MAAIQNRSIIMKVIDTKVLIAEHPEALYKLNTISIAQVAKIIKDSGIKPTRNKYIKVSLLKKHIVDILPDSVSDSQKAELVGLIISSGGFEVIASEKSRSGKTIKLIDLARAVKVGFCCSTLLEDEIEIPKTKNEKDRINSILSILTK